MTAFEALLGQPSLHWCLTPHGLRLNGQWRPGTESGCENCLETARQVQLRPKPVRKTKRKVKPASESSIISGG